MLRIALWILPLALLALAWLFWTQVRPILRARQNERARKEFTRNRAALQTAFFDAACATGKPRGLAWKECAFQNNLLLAQDRANGELLGLVAVTISFEAIQGGGMEEVEAVGNLRAATALFSWNGRQWSTQGRAVFNLEPRDVIERYKESLTPIHA